MQLMSRVTIAYLDEQKFSREEEGEALNAKRYVEQPTHLAFGQVDT